MLGNYDDGIVWLCSITNTSDNGLKPVERITRISKHFFEERTVSFRRQYAAKGVNEQIDMLIRIHYDTGARIGMVAELGNGDQFRIDNVTHAYDPDSRLRYTELTLARLEDFFDVAQS